MLGAIIGDTVGSTYEFNNIKTTDVFQRFFGVITNSIGVLFTAVA